MDEDNSSRRVELFVTCVVDNLFPETGEAALRVLRALGAEVSFNSDQTCCGQPAFNTGYWNDAKPLARRFLEQYDGTAPVIMPSGSCAAMVRHYYRQLFADDLVNRRRAEMLAPHIYEFTEFIVEQWGTDALSSVATQETLPTRVAFHESCHAKRELDIDSQPKALLDSLSQYERVDLVQSEVCCGFGGTFSVKYSDISGAMLSDKLDAIEESGADVVTACDSSCLMHIRGGLQKRGSAVSTAHVAELIAGSIERL